MEKTILDTSVSLPAMSLDPLDEIMLPWNRENAPGLAVGVYKNGILTHSRCAGLANIETCEPITTATNFRLASVSKALTAMAIMILKEAGDLRYDQLLTEFFPEFRSYGMDITLRQLMNHTSGLADYEDLIPAEQTKQIQDIEVVELLARQSKTYFVPGSAYRYSNSGYVILGIIVAKISGMSFSDFLQERIFAPLGMNQTIAFENSRHVIAHRAFGYTPTDGDFKQTDQSITSATLGDGGVYSSLAEFGKWDQALDASRLVSLSTMDEAFMPARLTSGEAATYGFGWVIDTFEGRRRISHTGSTIGFRSTVVRFPDQKITVLVLSNDAGTAAMDLATRVARVYL